MPNSFNLNKWQSTITSIVILHVIEAGNVIFGHTDIGKTKESYKGSLFHFKAWKPKKCLLALTDRNKHFSMKHAGHGSVSFYPLNMHIDTMCTWDKPL